MKKNKWEAEFLNINDFRGKTLDFPECKDCLSSRDFEENFSEIKGPLGIQGSLQKQNTQETSKGGARNSSDDTLTGNNQSTWYDEEEIIDMSLEVNRPQPWSLKSDISDGIDIEPRSKDLGESDQSQKMGISKESQTSETYPMYIKGQRLMRCPNLDLNDKNIPVYKRHKNPMAKKISGAPSSRMKKKTTGQFSIFPTGFNSLEDNFQANDAVEARNFSHHAWTEGILRIVQPPCVEYFDGNSQTFKYGNFSEIRRLKPKNSAARRRNKTGSSVELGLSGDYVLCTLSSPD